MFPKEVFTKAAFSPRPKPGHKRKRPTDLGKGRDRCLGALVEGVPEVVRKKKVQGRRLLGYEPKELVYS